VPVVQQDVGRRPVPDLLQGRGVLDRARTGRDGRGSTGGAPCYNRRMGHWSTAYKNRLPDSAFLAVSPGGRRDASGRTTPRSLRHLPVYDLQGRLSPGHVRAALGRISQTNISKTAQAAARRRARNLLLVARALEEEKVHRRRR